MADNINKMPEKTDTEKNQDKEIIVYHNDIDGATSAYIIKRAKNLRSTSKNIVFIPYDHNDYETAEKQIRSSLRTKANLHFVDISPRVDFLNEIMAPGNHGKRKIKSVNIIDHHGSVIAGLENYTLPIPYASDETPPKLNITINPDAPSAAILVWKQLMGEEKTVPEYVQIVNKMDRNNLKTKDDFAAAAYIDTRPIATPMEAIKAVSGLSRINFNTMAKRGRPIITAQKQIISQMLQNATFPKIEIEPNKKITVPMVNADVRNFGRQIDKHLIDIANEKGEGLAFAWYQQANGKVAVSIRSNGEPHAGDVAKHLKETFNIEGGGHNNSAAIVFPTLCEFEQNINSKDQEGKKAENAKKEAEPEINIEIQPTAKP